MVRILVLVIRSCVVLNFVTLHADLSADNINLTYVKSENLSCSTTLDELIVINSSNDLSLIVDYNFLGEDGDKLGLVG